MPGDWSVHRGAGRFPGMLLVFLSAASPCAAGPLLESALRAADRIVPSEPIGCAAAGEIAANERRRAWQWFAASAANAIYVIPVVPLFAHADREPPAEVLTDVPPADLECFTEAYRARATRRRAVAAWTGWAVSLASLVAYMVVVPDVGWDP